MEDQTILLQTAVMAKQKHFYQDDRRSFNTVDNPNDVWYAKPSISNAALKEKYFSSDEFVIYCSQTSLQRWLREVHQIEVRVTGEYYIDGVNWNVQALKWNLSAKFEDTDFIEEGSFSYGDNGEYPTYEEALEKGLQEALKLVKE